MSKCQSFRIGIFFEIWGFDVSTGSTTIQPPKNNINSKKSWVFTLDSLL